MLKMLSFFSELFEPAGTAEFNPETGAELLPGTLLDVNGHEVGRTDDSFDSIMQFGSSDSLM